MRDTTLARERFEEALRTMVRARSIAICEDPVGPAPATVMGFDIPSPWSHHRSRLEAVFDPARTLDGWTCQVLDAATHVAALLLEIERAHGRGAARGRGDGAAPLIGSSQAIRAVRERIERVAATDFTVLIEGESGTGQGAGGAADSRAEPPAQGPVRRGELRRDRGDAARGRAVRDRRPHGHRRARAARQVRARARRHAVPRRGLGSVVRRAGEAAACDSGSDRRARRRHRGATRQHPDHRRDQPPVVGAGRTRALPARSLLPAARRRSAGAAAARAARGRHRAGALLPRSPPAGAAAASCRRRPSTRSWRTTGRATCASWSA